MKLRYISATAMMLATTLCANAQDINHVKELLKQMQKEVEGIEQQQAEQALKIKPQPVESMPDTDGIIAIDTLSTINSAVKIVIFNDNTWKYIRDKAFVKDNDIYTKFWDTTNLFPYRGVSKADIPQSVVIDLVDSLRCYHFPYKGVVRSKYGPRRRRPHQGVDISLKVGDPIYAVFNGRVRMSEYSSGGYGNLVVVRHDNGLETYSAHMSERLVNPGDWVEAGQIIGYGGSTGRSTGPHIHFETRYYGQTFDPERLIDFESGNLRRETFLLKNSFFDIHSNAAQDFADEDGSDSNESVADATPTPTKSTASKSSSSASAKYHTVRSGDNLGKIAGKYNTTIERLCQLNNVTRKTILNLGRKIRVK